MGVIRVGGRMTLPGDGQTSVTKAELSLGDTGTCFEPTTASPRNWRWVNRCFPFKAFNVCFR